jgi:hypothetical protein
MRLKEFCGTSSGSISTGMASGSIPDGQFFGGDPASSIYPSIKKHRDDREEVVDETSKKMGPQKHPKALGPTEKVKKVSPLLGTNKNVIATDKFVGESAHLGKAGFIPYYKDGKDIFMKFVISSDPEYGGSKPMIAKGHIDAGEDAYTAAVREAHEECGLISSNLISNTIKVGWRGNITGMTETAPMTIYIGEVQNPNNFDKPGYEVSKTVWMTMEEYTANGRKSQLGVVQSCYNNIGND